MFTFLCIFQLGIQKMTPDGLLLGATSIVSQNKQLRKEMTDLEQEITTLRQQNKAMVRAHTYTRTHTLFLSENLQGGGGGQKWDNCNLRGGGGGGGGGGQTSYKGAP